MYDLFGVYYPDPPPPDCHCSDPGLPSLPDLEPAPTPAASPRLPSSSILFPPLLDGDETKSPFDRNGSYPSLYDPRGDLIQTFRHSHWKTRRAATLEALLLAYIQEPNQFKSNSSSPVVFSPGVQNATEAKFDSDLGNSIECKASQVLVEGLLSARKQKFEACTISPPEGSPVRIKRFCQCGSDAWLMKSNDPEPRYRVISNRCRDRFCEACQRERRLTLASNVANVLEGRELRLLTLTLKSTDDPLRAQLNRMYKCFRLFRNRKAIKRCMTGGLFFLEITLNDKTGQWHPHLHVIFEGTFLPHAVAKKAWKSCTEDSYIVDVRILRTSKEAADYVAKYASKGISNRVWHAREKLTEAILALIGRRTFSYFGSWLGLHLGANPKDESEWVICGRLESVLVCAHAGDLSCQKILRSLWYSPAYDLSDYDIPPPKLCPF